MKKKFFYLVCVVVIGIAAWNVSKSNNEVSLSDVALDNIEALASGESAKTCYDYGNVYCTNRWVYIII
ncbi:MAG: NVEALA domain-containing protein [Prevotellaceae bacterium]|jgi:hypothetical protein|nr:NVEALA domain-containing protein [Prevotellaceae bacterium]